MDIKDINWKKYFSYFKYWFLAILLLAVILAVLVAVRTGKKGPVRTNQECDTEERVFDYADVLNAQQEESLRQLIAEKERETACDIVLVTLNESLAEVAASMQGGQGTLMPEQYTKVYADYLYEVHKFGYNKPNGDGVLLLDNWYREADGGVYSWLCTTGRAEERFSSGMIDGLLADALENVDEDPYGAYAEYVTLFAETMTDTGTVPEIPLLVPIAAAVLGTALFVGINLKAHKGSRTVNLTTYVAGGRPDLRRKEDIFLRKTVTKRHIERNNGESGGSGGGGHHRSGGGVSHGGGGHRR